MEKDFEFWNSSFLSNQWECIEPERCGNSVYFPITNKYLLFPDDVLSSNTILEYAWYNTIQCITTRIYHEYLVSTQIVWPVIMTVYCPGYTWIDSWLKTSQIPSSIFGNLPNVMILLTSHSMISTLLPRANTPMVRNLSLWQCLHHIVCFSPISIYRMVSCESI